MSQIKAIAVRVSGRVQGVNFRAWTQAEAQGRGLGGWVQNEANGDVTAHLEGEATAVDAMQEALHTGPPPAVVRSVTAEETEPEGFAQFDIRR